MDKPLLTAPETRPFWQEVVHAFIYPLTPLGIAVIIGAGAVMALLTQPDIIVAAVSRDPRLAVGGLLITLLLTYYFFEVIQTSAGGTRWFPSFRKSDFDWYDTLFYGVEGIVVSYLPDLAYVATVFATGRGVNLLIFELLRALGCLYLPMALLALAIWRDGQAAMPQVVLPLMRKIPGAVVLSAIVFWAANSLHLEAVRGAFTGARFDIVGYTFAASAYLYFVAARVIGIAHWVYRRKIGWFEYD